MDNNGKWTYSDNDEFFNYGDYFDTKDDAIAYGKEYFDGGRFYIGQVEEVGLGVCVDVDSILEYINVNMTDEVGEVADYYLMNIDQEHSKELENEITNVIIKWIERHNYGPTFFKVVNIEKVE
ncbi:hypothetical protein WDD9_005644 [Paenibacillus melissococcoides]|uniref:hypothetical protein n=1 Tax=Paenibacillus TaxID=44249 RepID=UPI001B1FFB12|nr:MULTISPECIES: hypothetical protein [Paenibacillus]MEB9893783.1 hypothetical protein [Bacillus cereus]GIO79521.1 hypothetical protein J6TS7_31310 [Paenibacillus dendritiformis]CAH8718720.1 hypothetical protein HTL2_005370 [Paenibacillus melissococcoides]CAH8719724.1 hypothetical protein WDD9_005644 [Paenibacillus melissococcoides]